ncbi:MAG: sigma-54 dependent transcriptional regulator [Thermoanaerobaculia bacterium]
MSLVAPTDSTVFIHGETGTGKELVARAIHDRSRRRDRALVKVNCGSISAGLVESELFGHEKGAFTGAVRRRVGRFELADRGTIFLDEIGELPPETQVKLLRVLQEMEFERVGSSELLKVDVRVIAATNRDLAEAVKAGTFRTDLFYRLSVFPVKVPALRDRRSDIPLLASFFVERFAQRIGKQIEGVTEGSMKRLVSYSWPGNVRELQNVIEWAVILATRPLIEIDDVLSPGWIAHGPVAEMEPRRERSVDAVPRADGTLEEVERAYIRRVLEESGWRIGGTRGAATILGLHPNTLRSRMQKLGVKRP